MAMGSGFGAGAAALGILGSTGIFGGGGNVKNPYAGQADADYTNAENNAGTMTGYGTALGGAGSRALGDWNNFSPTANQSTQDYLDYLHTNPYTDAYSQSKIQGAQSHAMQGFAQARAHLASSLGARGLAGPGGPSSELSGGLAGIDAAQAGNLANLQNGVAMESVDQRGQRLGLANQIAAAHSAALFGQGEGGTQGGSSILGNAGNLYNQTGNNWLNQGQQEVQNSANAQGAASSAWGGLANIGLKVATGGTF